MNKGKKTTYEERMEIVSFCIANTDDCKLAADKFNVSYQQVYSWIKNIEKIAIPLLSIDEDSIKRLMNQMNQKDIL